MKSLLAGAFALALPLSAAAATLPPNEMQNGAGVISSGGSLSATFEPTEALDVDLTFTLNGLAADVPKVTFGWTAAGGMPFTPVVTGPSLAVSVLATSLKNVTAPFSVFVVDAGGVSSDVQVSFSAYGAPAEVAAPAPVPLPAAAGLLAATLAGLGLLAARRRA